MKRLLLILVAFVLLPAAACSLRQKPSGEDYYAQAQLNFATKEYKAAIENYQQVIDKYPFSPYAEDAEMKIGLAYYQQKDYAEAIGALDDFQRMHPTSKNLELVTYYIGLSYYDQIGREDQDQGKTDGGAQALPGIGAALSRRRLRRAGARQGAGMPRDARAQPDDRRQLLLQARELPRGRIALRRAAAEISRDSRRAGRAVRAGSFAREGRQAILGGAGFRRREKHFPNSNYAKRAQVELAKLHQPIDTEEDPLPLVLAETGYGGNPDDSNADKVVVRQRSDMRGTEVASSSGGSTYGADGLPNLDASTPPGAALKASSPEVQAVANAPDPSQPDLPSRKAGAPDMMRAPAPILPKPTGSIAGAASAQARAMTGLAADAPIGAIDASDGR